MFFPNASIQIQSSRLQCKMWHTYIFEVFFFEDCTAWYYIYIALYISAHQDDVVDLVVLSSDDEGEQPLQSPSLDDLITGLQDLVLILGPLFLKEWVL